MPAESATWTSSFAWAFLSVSSVSVASATPATDIRQPAKHVSVASGSRDTLMLSSDDVATWIVDAPALTIEAQNRLDELGQLPENWIGSEKPNEHALRVSRALVDQMERLGHRALHIAPMADGGVILSYAEGEHSAYFDVYNEGAIVMVTCVGNGAPAQFVELPEAEAAAALASFLQYDDDAAPTG